MDPSKTFRLMIWISVVQQIWCMQIRDRVDVAKDMICEAESDPTFINRIITGNETWAYEAIRRKRIVGRNLMDFAP